MRNIEVQDVTKMNPIKRVKNLFLSPKNLLRYIQKEPTIVFPVLITIMVNFLILGLRFSDFRVLVKEQLQGNEVEVTDTLVSSVAFFTPVITILSLIISILVLAVVFFAFMKALKGEGTFKQCLSVVAYSSVINSLGIILLFVISIFTGDFKFSTNLNIFDILNIDMASNFIYRIFNYITISNILSLWQHVLIAIGITEISKINKKYVYLFTLVVYLISIYMI